MKVKEIPANERPREKLESYGPSNLSTSDLLSIILASGLKGKNVTELSFELLSKVDSVKDLANLDLKEICKIKGIGKAKATTLLAAIELGKRIYLLPDTKKVRLVTAEDVFSYSKYLFYGKKQECFYCLYIDKLRNLITAKLLFMGTMERSSVHPREIFREAYKVSATGIICIHNHPSGVLLPSKKDIEFTNDLVKLGDFHGIYILDHLIVNENKYFSFVENRNKNN